MTKMTYVTALNSVLSCTNLDADVQERLTALRDSLVRRASAPRKASATPSKAKRENDALRVEILDFLGNADAPQSIEEICEGVASCAGKSTHSMAGLLSTLCKSGEVERHKGAKGKTLYALADEVNADEEEGE